MKFIKKLLMGTVILASLFSFSTQASARDIEWSLAGLASYYETHSIFGDESSSGNADPVSIAINGGRANIGLSREELESFVNASKVETDNMRKHLIEKLTSMAGNTSVTVGAGGLPTVATSVETGRSIFVFIWLLQLLWLMLQGMWTKISFAKHIFMAILCIIFLSPPGYSLVTGFLIGFPESLSAQFAEAEDVARAISKAAELSMETENSWTVEEIGGGVTQQKVGSGVNSPIVEGLWFISGLLVQICGFLLLGTRQLVLAIILLLGPYIFCFVAFEPVKDWGTAWLSALFSVAMWKPVYMLLMFLSSAIYTEGIVSQLSGEEVSIVGLLGWNFLIILLTISVPILTHSIIKGFGGFAVGTAIMTLGRSKRAAVSVARGGAKTVSAGVRSIQDESVHFGNNNAGGVGRNAHF